MGGSGGGIIVRQVVINTFNNPVVSGALPQQMQPEAATLAAKDPSTWTGQDCKAASKIFTWALCNLQ